MIVGDDPFARLEFEAPHVRLQCERQLKVVALAMRQAAVTVGHDRRVFHRAVLPSLLDVLRVLRGLLWLQESRQARLPLDMVRDVETLVGQPLAGVRRLVESPQSADWTAFEQFYRDVETLGRHADALQ